jgi:hypothetical protein
MVLSDAEQMRIGNITDWHPIIYTWLTNLSIQWFSTPTALIIFQIIAMAIALGWGLGYLHDLGVPQSLLWLIVLLTSLLPSSNLMNIKLLYDVPYATFFLIISVLLLKIAVTEGNWLERKRNLASLVISSLFLILFRHNGIFVIVGMFVVLFFFETISKYFIRFFQHQYHCISL